jgi:hypothetical protein
MIQCYSKYKDTKKNERLFDLLRKMVLSGADSIGIFVSSTFETDKWIDAVRDVLHTQLDSKCVINSASPSKCRISFKNGALIDIMKPEESMPNIVYDVVLCDDSISKKTQWSVVERRLRRR